MREDECQEGTAGYEIATLLYFKTNSPMLLLVIPFHLPGGMLRTETLGQHEQKIICYEAPMPESHSNSSHSPPTK